MNTEKKAPAKSIMLDCDSSQVQSIGYLQDEELLLVQFKFGGLYAYHKVPHQVFFNMQESESTGKFIETYVKPYFDFTKI